MDCAILAQEMDSEPGKLAFNGAGEDVHYPHVKCEYRTTYPEPGKSDSSKVCSSFFCSRMNL